MPPASSLLEDIEEEINARTDQQERPQRQKKPPAKAAPVKGQPAKR